MPEIPQILQTPPLCRDCDVAMEPGFIIDQSHGGIVNVARWCAGEPKAGWFFSEVKTAQVTRGVKAFTFRCPKCYRLESFAPPSFHV